MLALYAIASTQKELLRYVGLNIPYVQYRNKDPLDNDLAELLQQLPQSTSKIIINDSLEVALKLGAWGVHLGQEDLDKYLSTEILERNIKLGISTHNEAEYERAIKFNPDYVGFGPVFSTETKVLKYPPAGLAKLESMAKLSTVPVFAIGGICRSHTKDIFSTGAAGIAVISELTRLNDEEIKDWMSELQRSS